MVFEQKCTESKELNHVAIQRKLTPGTGSSQSKDPGEPQKGQAGPVPGEESARKRGRK